MPLSQELIRKYWDQQESTYAKIYKLGMREFVNQNTNSKDAFTCYDGKLCCIDEGTTGQEHLAGVGILWENQEELKIYIKKAKIKKIFSHANCGAAVLYAKKNNLDVSKSDEYSKEYAKNLAKELGLAWEHMEENNVNRPKSFHVARIIYYDGTNHFDYTLAKCFPPGFEVSRGMTNAKNAFEEVKLCCSMILDPNYGFGAFVDEFNPIVICPIGDCNNPEFTRGALTEEIANFLPKLNAEFGRKFIISGFTAPKQTLLDKIRLPQYFQDKLSI
jgi:hypothetical protein